MSSIGSSEPRARDTGQQVCKHEWILECVVYDVDVVSNIHGLVISRSNLRMVGLDYKCRNCSATRREAIEE